MSDRAEPWPALHLRDWEPTYKTLHRWTQVVGKVALGLCPPQNHWWHVSLRFDARGLRTPLMPYRGGQLSLAFDFIDHQLCIDTSHGVSRRLPLVPQSVASFYRQVSEELERLAIPVSIWPVPVEVPDPVPFLEDQANAAYDRAAVSQMWTILLGVHRVFRRFASRFVGKSSPVHFFWGAFDVALTRFSGRSNPEPPADPVMREGYSHEVISHGFWFGGDWPMGGRVEDPVFYAYAVPEPPGLREAAVEPAEARYAPELGEFVLPYEAVRRAEDPEAAILAFMQSTYAAAATLASWDRAALERS